MATLPGCMWSIKAWRRAANIAVFMTVCSFWLRYKQNCRSSDSPAFAVGAGSQHFNTSFCDGKGMLKVRARLAIGGDNCPVIGKRLEAFPPHIDHWLNSNHQTCLQR